MKKLIGGLLVVGSLIFVGCGGTGGPATNVMEGVEKSELEKYEEALKEEAEMTNKMMESGMEQEEAAPPAEAPAEE